MTSGSPGPDRPAARGLAAALVLPALLSALWLAAGVAGSVPPAPLPARSEAALMAAVHEGFLADAFAMVRAGQPTDAPLAFTHPDLTGGRTVRAAPLVLAVARGDENMVRMLLNWGETSAPQARLASCLARATGREALAARIEARLGPFGVACPAWQDDAPLLLAPTDETGRPLLLVPSE